MPTLVVVSCGKSKIWDRDPAAGSTKAKDAYTGVPFKLYKEYVKKFSNDWVILSAKYGFLRPDAKIPHNYNVTFKHPSTNPITVSQLKDQVRQKRLDIFDTLIVLGGYNYVQAVSEAFSGLKVNIKKPLDGLRLGAALAKVKKAIANNKPF